MEWLKALFYNALGEIGGYYVSRRVTADKIRILLYHRFGKGDGYRKLDRKSFEDQIRYLKKHYEIIRLEDYIKIISGRRNISRQSAVITIDDGYRDFYHYGYPILRKYGVPATVFLVTDFVDNKIWLWPDIIEYIFFNTRERFFEYSKGDFCISLPLDNMVEKSLAWSKCGDFCLKQANLDRREFIDQLSRILKVKVPAVPTDGYEPLTWEEVQETKKDGIDFGSHTATHPILARETCEDVRRELIESKKILESRLQTEIDSFCYPNGKKGDYDETTKKELEKAGYKCAVTGNDGFNDQLSDLFELNRVPCSEKYFMRKVNGLSYILEKYRAKFDKGRDIQ